MASLTNMKLGTRLVDAFQVLRFNIRNESSLALWCKLIPAKSLNLRALACYKTKICFNCFNFWIKSDKSFKKTVTE